MTPFCNILMVTALSSALCAASDDAAWHALGSGSGSGWNIWGTLCVGTEVYSSGYFSSIDNVSVSNIAHWTGTAWVPMGTGLNGRGDDVVTDGSNIYVIGPFTMAGGNSAQHIAVWNGTTWSTLGGGLPSTPYAAAFHNGELYVGGGDPAWLRKWNGTSWDLIASATSGGWVYAMTSYDSKLVIGGDFNNMAGGAANDYLVSWDGVSLSAFGAGIPYVVASLAVDTANGHLYASGQFLTAGGNPAVRAARWNGSAWAALGSGLDEAAEALIFTDGLLYAFGGFTTADGNPASRAAVWDGSDWNPLGSGVNGKVHSASLSPRGIVLGGEFSLAGSLPARLVAIHNQSHRAQHLTITAADGLPKTGVAVAQREDGAPLSISILSGPSHGSLSLDNPATGAFTYTATAGYAGSDRFMFLGSDVDGESNPGLVTITVLVDAISPVITILVPAAPSVDIGSATQTTLSGTASDAVGVVSMAYTLSGATTGSGSIVPDSTWNWTTPALLPGITTIQISAADAAGNIGTASVAVMTTASGGSGGGGGGSAPPIGSGTASACSSGSAASVLGLLVALLLRCNLRRPQWALASRPRT